MQGYFPEAKAHHANQICSVKAGCLVSAAKLGLQELRSRPGLAGKQLKTVQLTIRLIDERPAVVDDAGEPSEREI